MEKNVTFAIISHSGCKIQKITAPKNLLYLLGFIVAGSLVFLSVFIFKFKQVKTDVSQTQVLKHTVAVQNHQIDMHNEQIESFTKELDSLKKTLAKLDTVKQKIRIVADIEKKDGQNVFGVGGSESEGANTEDAEVNINKQNNGLNKVPMEQKGHNKGLLTQLEGRACLLTTTPSMLPAKGSIIATFGYCQSPIDKQKELYQGLGIRVPNGAEIVATADGIITYSGIKGRLGNTVIIHHGHGLVTRYGHLTEILKVAGDKVKRGDVIARIGKSGKGKAYQIYYEVRVNGIPVNPEKYIGTATAVLDDMAGNKRS